MALQFAGRNRVQVSVCVRQRDLFTLQFLKAATAEHRKMTKRKRKGGAKETSQLKVPAGVRLLRTLEGHTDIVNSVASSFVPKWATRIPARASSEKRISSSSSAAAARRFSSFGSLLLGVN